MEWILLKRRELQDLMWSSAGIRRQTRDLQAALKRLHVMSIEAQVPIQP